MEQRWLSPALLWLFLRMRIAAERCVCAGHMHCFCVAWALGTPPERVPLMCGCHQTPDDFVRCCQLRPAQAFWRPCICCLPFRCVHITVVSMLRCCGPLLGVLTCDMYLLTIHFWQSAVASFPPGLDTHCVLAGCWLDRLSADRIPGVAIGIHSLRGQRAHVLRRVRRK